MSVDQKIVEDIKKYGWHIINIFEGVGVRQFSYSIGLTKSFSSPELFTSGIDGKVAASILNNIATEIKSGKKLSPKLSMTSSLMDTNAISILSISHTMISTLEKPYGSIKEIIFPFFNACGQIKLIYTRGKLKCLSTKTF